ncbi:hypothetical protein OEZ86_009149 [Tetradesmus obliquus]|nr:hypothetical protein OEZ86_009149 [Tetradesmus obliquus]
MCASRNTSDDSSSSSTPNSTSQIIIKVAVSVSNAVGRPLGFAAGCLPAGTQLQKSNITIVFEFVLCSLSTDPSTLFSRYVKATLVSAFGAVLRSRTGADCIVRNSPRLAKTTASHMFGSCGVAPAIANGTLPNAICIETSCYTADPTSTEPSPPDLSPSTDVAAAAAAASPTANATAAAGSIGACKGGRRKNGKVAADPLEKFGLSDVLVGTMCCADEPETSVASTTTAP